MASSSSNSLELNLSLRPSYQPKTIPDILKELSEIENDSDKLSFLDGYIHQHEEELKSISAFKQQLPQCLLLLMEGLKKLNEECTNIKNGMKSENNANLMEFMGGKRKHWEAEATRLAFVDQENCGGKGESTLMSLASPQPWSHQNKNQKQFIDFIEAPNLDQNPNIALKESSLGLSIGEEGWSSSKPCATNNGADPNYELLKLKVDNNQTLNYHPNPLLTQPNWRKTRRFWSPELHAKFEEALKKLGGIEVATPKKIREAMKVEGLTNDQVKSHLQKYRLHCRRPPGNHAEVSVNVQAPPNYFVYPNFPSQGSQHQHNSNL